jgi:hypothetical protein
LAKAKARSIKVTSFLDETPSCSHSACHNGFSTVEIYTSTNQLKPFLWLFLPFSFLTRMGRAKAAIVRPKALAMLPFLGMLNLPF